jgi:hypothetical protein
VTPAEQLLPTETQMLPRGNPFLLDHTARAAGKQQQSRGLLHALSRRRREEARLVHGARPPAEVVHAFFGEKKSVHVQAAG